MAKYSQEELYSMATTRISGVEKRIGGKTQYVPDYCPYCSKENDRGFHSSFGPIFHDGGYGFKCFVCGETVGIYSLAKFLGADIQDYQPQARKRSQAKPKTSPNWYSQRDNVLKFVTSRPDRYEAWDDYKRVDRRIVDEYQLGTGVLVGTQFRDHRLITPFLSGDDPVWFRGRGEKGWIGSYGVSPKDIRLPLIDRVPLAADVVLMTENYVDGILVNEHTPYSAVSVLGVSYWFDSWQEQLLAKKPKLVIVAFDADLAGNLFTWDGVRQLAIKRGAGWARAKHKIENPEINITATREAEHGWEVDIVANGVYTTTIRIPPPYGVKRVNQLRRVGLDAVLFPWRRGDVGKDVGTLFLDWMGQKEAG